MNSNANRYRSLRACLPLEGTSRTTNVQIIFTYHHLLNNLKSKENYFININDRTFWVDKSAKTVNVKFEREIVGDLRIRLSLIVTIN